MSTLFEYVDVKSELVRFLRLELQDNGVEGVKVLKSDPREQTEIPCICINRVGDDEANQVLGDDFGEDTEEEDFSGTHFQESMEIRLWHQNPDERDKLYILIKALLLNFRSELSEKGLFNISIRGGRDEQDNTYPPHPLYWATLTLNYINPMSIEHRYRTITAIDTNEVLG